MVVVMVVGMVIGIVVDTVVDMVVGMVVGRVVVGLRLVVGVEVVLGEVVVVRVEVEVKMREVMRVVVLVGDCPGLTDVVVLEEVVVWVVLCAPCAARASLEVAFASVGDFDLQLK
jgi:hypothetical protein